MRAQPGDTLLADGTDEGRIGVIIRAEGRDGSPPFVVRWRLGGHMALVHPGPYARVVPAGAAARRAARDTLTP